MKHILLFLLLLATILRAQEAAMPADAQRAMKEYDAAVDGARRRLVAQLQAVMQSETTRGRLDAAVAVRSKIAELAPGAAAPAGAAAAATPAPAGTLAGGAAAEQVYVIEAKDDKGTLIGPAKRGQRIRAQYVEGTWSASEGKMRSPEEPAHPMQQVAVIGITAAGEDEVVAIVPGGTKRRTFSEAFKKDYTEIRLRCNDGTRNDNFGSVKYKASIR